MKLVKRLIVFILILIIGLVVGSLLLANSIEQPMDESVLPTDVYESETSHETVMASLLTQMIFANDDTRYTLVEEYINHLIYDSIINQVNADYNPLGDDESTLANTIVSTDYYYIDLVVATLNDDNQLVIDIAFGSNYAVTVDSVISLVFDIEIILSDFALKLTLASVDVGGHPVSFKMLDAIVNRLDQTVIEDSVTTGTLNLDDYTYQVSLINP